jgi:hypothetical protein
MDKNFKDGAIDKLISDMQGNKKKVGRPRKYELKEKASEDGLPEEYTRATFIVKKDLLKKLKGYAFLEDKQLKEVVNEMLEEFLEDKRDIREELKGGK